MNISEIKQKLTQFQSTLTLLQKEERMLIDELKTLGINSVEEAKSYLAKLTDNDISTLEQEVTTLEKELAKWLQS